MSAGDWAMERAREILHSVPHRDTPPIETIATALREAKRAGRESMRNDVTDVANHVFATELTFARKDAASRIIANISALPLDEPSRSTDAGGGNV